MYNNPYNFYPYMNSVNGFNAINGFPAAGVSRAARPGLFQAFRNIKWNSILTNTQKTLNVINQAIPVYYQIKPIASNLRSFGKIMSAFNSPDNSSNSNNSVNNNSLENQEIKKALLYKKESSHRL